MVSLLTSASPLSGEKVELQAKILKGHVTEIDCKSTGLKIGLTTFRRYVKVYSKGKTVRKFICNRALRR
jgi:hypothetical protein